MTSLSINTFEDIHHVCLMYGLKKAYARFPFLAGNIMATPPPVRRNPERRQLSLGTKANIATVQYYSKDIRVLYDETRTNENEITEFAKAVMEEYLTLRHPYMKTSWDGCRLTESSSSHLIAEILR